MKKTYNIVVDCANCANLMELAINKLENIDFASVNFITQKLIIEFNDIENEIEIKNNIIKICQKIESNFEIE